MVAYFLFHIDRVTKRFPPFVLLKVHTHRFAIFRNSMAGLTWKSLGNLKAVMELRGISGRGSFLIYVWIKLLQPVKVLSILYPVTIAAPCLNHSQSHHFSTGNRPASQCLRFCSRGVTKGSREGSRALCSDNSWENGNLQQSNYKKKKKQ